VKKRASHLSLPHALSLSCSGDKNRDEAGVTSEIAHDETERQHIEIESG
jgi:hypothetical protein